MITTSGPFSLARSNSMVTASNSCSRMVSSLSRGAGQVGQQRAERLPPRAGPLQDLLPAVLGHQIAQAHRQSARTADLRHPSARIDRGSAGPCGRPARRTGRRRTPRRLSSCRPRRRRPMMTKRLPSSITSSSISAQPGTLLRPPDDVVGARGGGRPGRSNHKHYRATWL